MTPFQPTPDTVPQPDAFRWPRSQATQTCHDFHDPQRPPTSQRQFAQQAGVPRSTLQYWEQQRRHPDLEPELVAFCESPTGLRFLQGLVTALHLVYHQAGHAGLRPLSDFLRLTQLDHFVAPSYGSQQTFAVGLRDQLIAYAAAESPRLAADMAPKDITLCADENFHGAQVCLVAIEPVSGFLLVEEYHDHRDGATWTAAIQQAVAELPVTVVQLTSDQARGLLACARDGLEAHHSPDLFHNQQELTKSFSLALQRQVEAAEQVGEQRQQQTQAAQRALHEYQRGPRRPGRPPDFASDFYWSKRWEEQAAATVTACRARQEQAHAAVRGFGDAYHPFDASSGRPVAAAVVEQRLTASLDALQAVATAAALGERSQEAVRRVRGWLGRLVATIAWFWGRVQESVEGLGLSAAAERVVFEQLLPGLYWQQAAERGRDAEQRQQRQALARRLLEAAWSPASPLRALSAAEQEQVRRVAAQVGTLFQRSSSCVEGRNGRLSLCHHGQGALSGPRLQALTVVHNYLMERADGTTAAERFFGSKPLDLFAWLLARLPEIPRPACGATRERKRPAEAIPTRPNP
jgi:hypothetical protein